MSNKHGYVPTPPCVADYMTRWLFAFKNTTPSKILYPGLGTGNLHDAVHRYFDNQIQSPPEGTAFEIDDQHVTTFTNTHPDTTLEIRQTDFLLNPPSESFDYIIANPPYIPYSGIPEEKRDLYRDRFNFATGQFKLQHLFFEQCLNLLADDGCLVFLTPYKFLCFDSDEPLRQRIRQESPQAFISMPRPIFPNHTVDTVVSVIKGSPEPTLSDPLWIEELHPDHYRHIANALEFNDDIHDRYLSGVRSKQRSVFTRGKNDSPASKPVTYHSSGIQTGLNSF